MTEYLVRAGGELYVPCLGCSRGLQHFDSVDVPAPEIDTEPDKLVLPYLFELLDQLRMVSEDDPKERVNLLYPNGEILTDLWRITDRPVFDFFVRGCDPRFRYARGAIHMNGEPMDRKMRKAELTNQYSTLILTHVATPEAPFLDKKDYDVVFEWEKDDEKRHRARTLDQLREHVYNSVLDQDWDLLTASVALALVPWEDDIREFGHDDLIHDTDDIADTVLSGDYWCGCDIQNLDRWDVDHALGRLLDDGVVEKTGYGYRLKKDFLRHEVNRETQTDTRQMELPIE